MTAPPVDLKALVARIDPARWHCRFKNERLTMLSGTHGSIRPAGDVLVLCLRTPALCKKEQFDKLAACGVLVSGELETILIGRLPDQTESRWMRELVGFAKANRGDGR